MIDFPCLCGEKFSVPTELAGTQFQCPKCALLVSVPTLDDLANLGADGTYDVDDSAPATHNRRDVGMLPADSVIHAPDDLNHIDPDAPAPPRYDPFTGELIRPIEMERHIVSAAAKAPPRVQPMSKTLRGLIRPAPRYPWLWVLGELFMVRNMFVLFLMLILHLLLFLTFFLTIGAGLAVLFFMPAIFIFICMGHPALIIRETGPGESDQLPAPFHNFDMRGDLWDPFLQAVVATVLCFAPAVIVWRGVPDNHSGAIVAGALAVIGAFFFPAVLLTAAMDGIIENFRPDRVWGVIRICGSEYIAVFVGVLLGAALWLDGMWGFFIGFAAMFHVQGEDTRPHWFVPTMTPGIVFIAAGLYFGNYASWLLGLLWRKRHKEFPWVGQVHVKAPVAMPPPRPSPKPDMAPVRSKP
jgi:hypothetical protein